MYEANQSQQAAPGLVKNASILCYQQGRGLTVVRDMFATTSTTGAK